jgi:hypothetical protein
MKPALVVLTVAVAAAATTLAWWASYQLLSPIPWPVNTLLLVALLGLPAYGAAAVLASHGVPRPVVWATAAYCIGAGIFVGMVNISNEVDFSRRLIVAAIHAVTLTLTMPLVDGGFALAILNGVWLAAAVICAMTAVERFGTKPPAPTTETQG